MQIIKAAGNNAQMPPLFYEHFYIDNITNKILQVITTHL